MRKLIAIITAVLLLLSLTACGEPADNPLSSAAESEASTSAQTTTTTATSTAASLTTTSRRSASTTTTTTTTTTAPMTEREKYLSQMKIWHVGSEDDEKTGIYQLGLNGVMVREATIESGRGGEPVEIVQVTDIHFNYLNDQDFAENNPSVMSTYAQREHMKDGYSRKNAEACMYYGGFFDQIVVTGDTIDYLTYGAMEMLKEIIWDPYPGTLVALGNHDPVRVMGLGKDVADPSSLESRYQILQKNWKHDVYYTSKVVKNKVMVIQLDNSQNKFWDSQIPKLKADIETARKKGYVILLFAHIPLSTNNPAETGVYEIARNPKSRYNFYTGGVGGINSTGATREIWDMIMNNADVIRGVFAGHIHEDYYAEMLAKTPSGEQKIIPQYVNFAAWADKGHVLKITVK